MEDRFQPFHPAFRFLFNSYYNGIGDRHPRAKRGLLTRPSLAEVRAYRADVDERIGRLLAAQADNPALAALIELGLQHEQQHQELILTDVQHLLAQNALNPAYAPRRRQRPTRRRCDSSTSPAAWWRSGMRATASASTTSCRATASSSNRLRWPTGW
jgi:hypothetical protein